MSRDAGRGRRTRERVSRGASLVGQEYDVEVGPVAHGGHCVARHEGRVIFVRHALPGEQVRVRVTEGEEGSAYLRADAVRIDRASVHRVQPPCPVAVPLGCGGCDFQHATLAHQRELKAAVLQEQLSRLAGLELEVTVQPVAGDLPVQDEGLRWRTRMQYERAADGGRGLRRHRSHDVVPIEDCPIAHPDAREPGQGTGAVTETVVAAGQERAFEVAADGFWQVHPGAPRVLVETVLEFLAPQPGESVLDLYAGVGLFAGFLAPRVAPGQVEVVEGDRTATSYAKRNLAGTGARVHTDRVDRWLARRRRDDPDGHVDLVVLDPPRAGAKRAVVAPVAALRPRAIAYVACDPAALARDVGTFAAEGYELAGLRAFDLFPMTHHVEAVALLVPRRHVS